MLITFDARMGRQVTLEFAPSAATDLTGVRGILHGLILVVRKRILR